MYLIHQPPRRNGFLFMFIAITVAMLYIGCSEDDIITVTPVPTVTNSPTPTLSSTPRPTNTTTPSPTPSPSPTNTPTPSPTNTPTPSSRPNKLYHMYSEYGTQYTLEIEYQDYLYQMCVKYEIAEYYELLMAQMWHESRFNPNAYSDTNDYGLMQINKCNHKSLSERFGKTDFFDPYFSMECGVYMMSKYLKKYDDVQKALVCYNSGASKVRNGTYSTKYSRCVLADMERLVEMEQ